AKVATQREGPMPLAREAPEEGLPQLAAEERPIPVYPNVAAIILHHSPVHHAAHHGQHRAQGPEQRAGSRMAPPPQRPDDKGSEGRVLYEGPHPVTAAEIPHMPGGAGVEDHHEGREQNEQGAPMVPPEGPAAEGHQKKGG